MLPSMEELDKAINALANRKAPGADGIPPEILKTGKPALMQHLYELLGLCLENGYVPQDMRDAVTVTLYKSRTIAVTVITTEVFRSESRCGFRPGRSTTDMIFSLRQVQEKCREQRMPFYITFIDLTKAFDLVSRRGLLEILKRIGCSPRLLNIIASFHEDTHNIVSFKGTTSEVFPVSSGVKQGCVLAPTLFGVFS